MHTFIKPKVDVFFHINNSKTDINFLQHGIFPKLKGIKYIKKNQFNKASKIINQKKTSSYLVTKDIDGSLERDAQKFSQELPNSKAIIIFRRQDNYMANLYRRSLKDGFSGSFKEFIDIETNAGCYDKDHLFYMNQISILEKYFNQKPLVLFYNDLAENPDKFASDFANKLNTTIRLEETFFHKTPKYYSSKQLKALRHISKYIDLEKRKKYGNRILNFIWNTYSASIRFCILKIAKLIPNKFTSKEPLIPDNDLMQLQKYFSNDWKACLNYNKLPKATISLNKEMSRIAI